MKHSVFLFCFLLLALVAVRDVRAHGGVYTGPGGVGTGDGFTPGGGGTPTPTTPGGTGHTGGGKGGGGETGGGGGGGSSGGQGGGTRGATPGAPGQGLGAPGTSGGGKKAHGETPWLVWWRNNDDRFLRLRAHLRSVASATDSSGDIFVGEVALGDDIVRGLAPAARRRVLATLKGALKDPFFDARAAAEIALGKVASAGMQKDIMAMLGDENQQVRESACLALGLLGDKASVADLIDIMKNTARAKRDFAPGGKDLSTRTRAFAALALGLIGARTDLSDTQAVESLIAQARAAERHEDLNVTPIVALGVMRAKSAVPELIRILKDESLNARVRCYAATSLGKIGEREALQELVRALGAKEASINQSAAIAIGAIAHADDDAAVQALMRHVRSTPDANAKNFGIIALGEAGGAPARDFLLKLIDDSNQSVRSFAALALGVYGWKYDDANESAIADRMLKVFNSEKNPELCGAFAIGLGLMKYQPAAMPILARLQQTTAASARAPFCTSLGLLGSAESVKTIQDIVADKGDVDLRREAAIALGLLGDREAVGILQKVMEESASSIALNGAATQALGFIGDTRAVEPLSHLLEDRKTSQDATRAFAAVALGLLGDKDEISLLSRIAENDNYLLATEAMAEVLTIL